MVSSTGFPSPCPCSSGTKIPSQCPLAAHSWPHRNYAGIRPSKWAIRPMASSSPRGHPGDGSGMGRKEGSIDVKRIDEEGAESPRPF